MVTNKRTHTRHAMNRMSPLRLAALALGIAIAPLQAQSNPPLGKWNIEYARGMRVENDVPTPVMGTGTLTIVQDADSLLGTIDGSARADGTTAPTTKLSGRLNNGSAVLISRSKAKVNMNGEMNEIDITVTWTLPATGDALSGTLLRKVGVASPMADAPASPVKGTRIKS